MDVESVTEWSPTVGHRRRPRAARKPVQTGDLQVAPPPELARAVPQSLVLRLLPAVMVVAVIGMVAMMALTGGRTAFSNPLFLMFPLMMLMSMVGMVASGGRGGPARAAEVNEDRKDYLRHLGQLRTRAERVAADQRADAERNYPDPIALPAVVGSSRMWERRPSDDDFCDVRVGVGTHRLACAVQAPETAPADAVEPVSAVALRRFVQTWSAVPNMPTALAIRGFPAVSINGQADSVNTLVRAMLCGLVTQHGPDHLGIAVVVADPLAQDWDWLKWLPHLGHPTRRDALGPARMLYTSLDALEADLADDLSARGRFSRTDRDLRLRQLIVVLADGDITGDEDLMIGAGLDAVTVLELGDRLDSLAARRGLALVVGSETLSAHTEVGLEEFAVPDRCDRATAEVIARRLARYRPATFGALVDFDTPSVVPDPGLPELLGIPDIGVIDPVAQWTGRRGDNRLRVPIGYSTSGTPVMLDLKESAHGGMGPHGLCVGATGSGKSELLRTLVLGLIATHSPEELNLVLVDFKGGATFLGLDTRHVAAVITNLEAELELVDRMADALSGELHRRQEVLRAAGNFANVTEYDRARAGGADLPPMPALVIVVDEFSELLAQKPDFAELFVAIGRLGRSLHIHLLLASQRLEEGRLRGLDSHLSYRIGLKTFSASESRTVLGVPDAYHLPSEPGAAYLKCDSAVPIRFRTSYVSGPYTPPAGVATCGDGQRTTVVTVLRADTVIELPEPSDAVEVNSLGGPTVLQTIVTGLAECGAHPHQVWLPPLARQVTLDEVPTGDVAPLSAVIGVIDRPYDQRRDPLRVDLAGGAGHVAIVGGPQTGKSMAVKTLICALARRHGPTTTTFYCLDFGGGGLGALADLPHVGGVAPRNRRDLVRRTVAEVTGVLHRRESAFADSGIESMATYRSALAAGDFPDDRYGDVFLVVDGYGILRSEFEELDDQLADLVARGLSYGVHLVITAGRWAEIRPHLKDLIGTRIELRLGDALDSEMDRRAAARVPADRPGRGMTAEGLHLLVALPTLADAQPGEPAPRVRALTTELSADDFRLVCADLSLRAGQVAIGLGEATLTPHIVDFEREPNLLIIGDTECGKTATLRALIGGIVASGTGDDVKVVLVDFRRALLGVVDTEHLGGYTSSVRTAGPMMTDLAAHLSMRLPPDDATAEQLRDRSWWTGPDVYLVIDDYDLVATAAGNPLAPLVDLLAHARDIGFRVILARRSGGIGRALFDPFIARLRDLSCDVLLMSGDADEGYIVGRRRMQRLPAGRGEYISRDHGVQTIQVVAP